MSEAHGGRIRLHPSWQPWLNPLLEGPTMAALRTFLVQQARAGKTIYPPARLIFNALDSTPFDRVRVVILGQDPYHGPGQAHGLCFSVPRGVAIPPSLVNIYAELKRDLGLDPPAHGCLESWAAQGVLLLNAVLTVEAGRPGSHQNRGWEIFTDQVVDVLNRERRDLVFMLWGRYAQHKGRLVDGDKHLVLKAPHPSPLSAHQGFIGCGHFSRANAFLERRGLGPIDWRLPP